VDSSAGLPTVPAGPATARALYAQTDQTPNSIGSSLLPAGQGVTKSDAGVATLVLAGGGHVITADALTSHAQFVCVGGRKHAVASGSSNVVNLKIDGQGVTVPGGPQSISFGPLGTLYLNQQIASGFPDRLVQRALFLDTDLVDVVVAESKVDKAPRTNPCA
jgi:hypothetical protein